MARKQITIGEAAGILGVSKGTIHAYIKSGKLSSKRKSGRIYVFDNDVYRLKKKGEHWGWLLKQMRLFYVFIQKVVGTLKRHPKTSIGTVSVPLVALLLQYFIARPYIIESEIKTDGESPFKHEFVITNSGMITAYDLDIKFFEPYIQTKFGVTYLPVEGESPTWEDATKIAGIKVAPNQCYSFSPDVWFDPQQEEIQKALINLRFTYTDFLHLFHYEDECCYCLVSEGDKMVWKAVGPRERQKISQEFQDVGNT